MLYRLCNFLMNCFNFNRLIRDYAWRNTFIALVPLSVSIHPIGLKCGDHKKMKIILYVNIVINAKIGSGRFLVISAFNKMKPVSAKPNPSCKAVQRNIIIYQQNQHYSQFNCFNKIFRNVPNGFFFLLLLWLALYFIFLLILGSGLAALHSCSCKVK